MKTITKRKKRSILLSITRHKTAIAKHRDELRYIMDDLEAIDGSMNEAVEQLESVIDTMSQYV